jgi:hypothetical protein
MRESFCHLVRSFLLAGRPTRWGDGLEMSILIQRNYTSFVQALGKQAATNDILGAALAVNVNIPPNYEAVWRDGIRVK